MKRIAPLIFFLSFSFMCKAQIDKEATQDTKNLYRYLNKTSKKHVLFGHQHATEYGHGWTGDENRSDVKSIIGSHPAVIGVDFSGLSGQSENKIKNNIQHLVKNISDTYNRGGITTVAWHFSNPEGPGGFYYKDSTTVKAMALIKVGGSHHQKYKEILKTISEVAKESKGKDGKLVPMIFRPFHEFDGDWFWWGKSHTTREDFIDVWQFTVNYLKDSLDVHNFIYAFSPDNKFSSESEFKERYPGNDFVDMVGMDNYGDFGRNGAYNLEVGLKKLLIVSDFAKKNKKLAAFTETGLESIPNPNWWTETLLKTLKSRNLRLSYVLVWRNDTRSPSHFYAPYPGQVSEVDFIKFYEDSFTFFEKDMKRVYKKRFF